MIRVPLRQIIVELVPAFAVMVGVAAAETPPANLVIRIYDGTATAAANRAAARQTAATIVANAGIEAAWYDCTDDSQRTECASSRGGRELIIRIMATAPRGTVVTGGAVETDALAPTFRLILGFAVIDPVSGVGSLATVFMDRIEALARRTDVPASSLLGLTIAHEVGHLLLGTATHGRTGLMREVWTDEELALGREDDWLFAPSERQMLRSVPR